VVAAHPDDEVLGCGATIARHAAEGDEVRVLILGEGGTDRPDGTVTELMRQARHAADTLGMRGGYFSFLPDNAFDTVPLLDIVQSMEEKIADFRPDMIYTHHAGDLNIDHELTHRAVLTATRPMAGTPVRAIYAFEVPSATEWAFGRTPFTPDTYVDVSGHLDAKIAALECYAGEIRDWPHPRSAVAIRALAAWRGATVGVDAAEAFMTVRRIW
jgi:LmbE family N-acetylglucosaminyl deacetylase